MLVYLSEDVVFTCVSRTYMVYICMVYTGSPYTVAGLPTEDTIQTQLCEYGSATDLANPAVGRLLCLSIYLAPYRNHVVRVSPLCVAKYTRQIWGSLGPVQYLP